MAGCQSLKVSARQLALIASAFVVAVVAVVGLSAHSGVFTLAAAHGEGLGPSIHDGDLVLAIRADASSTRPGQVVAVRSGSGFTLTTAAAVEGEGSRLVATRVVPGLGHALTWIQTSFVRFVLAACMPLTLLVIIGSALTRSRNTGDRRPVGERTVIRIGANVPATLAAPDAATTTVNECAPSSSSSLPVLIRLNEQSKVSPLPLQRAPRELVSVSG